MLVGEPLRSFKPCGIVLEMSVLPQTNNAALLLAEQLVAEWAGPPARLQATGRGRENFPSVRVCFRPSQVSSITWVYQIQIFNGFSWKYGTQSLMSDLYVWFPYKVAIYHGLIPNCRTQMRKGWETWTTWASPKVKEAADAAANKAQLRNKNGLYGWTRQWFRSAIKHLSLGHNLI